MKFARYEVHGETAYGVVEGGAVRQLTASPFDEHEVTDHAHALSEVRLVAPCTPSKIYFMGGNYSDHLGGAEPPAFPQVYIKTPNSIIGPGETIVVPGRAGSVQEEAELVAVIGKPCRNVSEADALDYVLGYTCGNDVSARDWQRSDPTFWRAKASDTFSPIGPYIVTGLDPSKLTLRARVNGEQVQECKTSDLIFDTAACISYISQSVTLEPGDIIYTGTGGTQVDLKQGDVVEIEIEEIGVLTNPVVVE
jgi:2-keto-4-pentenoate hydratase/2-oxohepta-3-ene-1,7-dioic acid hydratase in catechol pathway